MSSGKNLQEMEVKTQQSRTAVNAGAKPADPMPKLTTGGTPASYEDLGGPTPENYKVDDDSAKLKTPGGTLKQVKDVVNKGAKPADAMKGMKEEEEVSSEEVLEEEPVATEATVEEEIDIEEDVNALLGGEDLSEEFREKAKMVFESALNSKVSEIHEALEAQYEIKLEEAREGLKEALTDRVDSYLEYVAEEWMTENELAIEHGLKTEMTESFLSGMKGLFEEHYVTIPDDKYDVVENMVDKLDEMESKLNEQIEKNITITKSLSEATGGNILSDVSEGLSTTQKEKLASRAEGVEFESEESYKEKLETLKESYFKAAPKRSDSEVLNESAATPDVSGSMAAYIQALSHATKK